MKKGMLAFIIIGFLFQINLNAQERLYSQYFTEQQLQAPRVSAAYQTYNQKLRNEFDEKGLTYPPQELYIRAFKGTNEMEIWVKNQSEDTFQLFKSYDICALSGSLGPKRWEGDRQVPEGFYFISDFNARSDFHLSMLLNYPNYSDLIMGNKHAPGSAIYIHGGCYTIGCLPMTDQGIKEIYTLSLVTKINGQNNIPVHVFPVRFNEASIGFLAKEYGNDIEKQKFWLNLKVGYDYFENNKKILPVMYNQEGKYVY